MHGENMIPMRSNPKLPHLDFPALRCHQVAQAIRRIIATHIPRLGLRAPARLCSSHPAAKVNDLGNPLVSILVAVYSIPVRRDIQFTLGSRSRGNAILQLSRLFPARRECLWAEYARPAEAAGWRNTVLAPH